MTAAIAGAGTISTTITAAADAQLATELYRNPLIDSATYDIYKDVPEELTTRIRPHGTRESLISKRTFTISIETVVMSALIFIAILSWFEFLRAWYDHTFDNEPVHNVDLIFNRFWYAVFISSICIIIIYVLYVMINSQ